MREVTVAATQFANQVWAEALVRQGAGQGAGQGAQMVLMQDLFAPPNFLQHPETGAYRPCAAIPRPPAGGAEQAECRPAAPRSVGVLHPVQTGDISETSPGMGGGWAPGQLVASW